MFKSHNKDFLVIMNGMCTYLLNEHDEKCKFCKEHSVSSTPDTSACDGLYLSRYAGDNKTSTAAVKEMFLQ